jgi:SAM-dependent methyltransferase
VNTRVIDMLAEDVCEYLHEPVDQFARVCGDSTQRLVRLWHEGGPRDAERILGYYREHGKDYIGDLAGWHLGRSWWFQHEHAVLSEYGVRTLLDFGCGIGTDSLMMADNGFDVTLADASPGLLDFAEWRAARHGIVLSGSVLIPDGQEWLDARYDAIFLLDVLEHLPDYDEVATRLAAKAAKLVAISAPFADRVVADEAHPQHLVQSGRSVVEIMQAEWVPVEGSGLFWRRR